MLNSTLAWWKTVNGYSGFLTPAHFALFQQLSTFPSDESLHGLAAFGVTDIIVHADDYSPGDWPAVKERLAATRDSLTLEHMEGEDRVYAVKASLDGKHPDRAAFGNLRKITGG
jgi:hypothetical protein